VSILMRLGEGGRAARTPWKVSTMIMRPPQQGHRHAGDWGFRLVVGLGRRGVGRGCSEQLAGALEVAGSNRSGEQAVVADAMEAARHYSMFVRWQRYRSQACKPWHRERNDEHARLKAILVESVRVNGKPRQRHIAFLGSVSIAYSIDGPGMRRFWYDVTLRLNRLGARVGPEDYQQITASIAKKVGGRPMTEAELEQFERGEQLLGRRLLLCWRACRPSPTATVNEPNKAGQTGLDRSQPTFHFRSHGSRDVGDRAQPWLEGAHAVRRWLSREHQVHAALRLPPRCAGCAYPRVRSPFITSIFLSQALELGN